MSDSNAQALSPDQGNNTPMASKYAVTIRECRFEECSDETAHHSVGQISENGLSLAAGSWQATISHETPGRLVLCYTNPATGEKKHFYRVLKDGVMKLECSPKVNACWDSIVPVQEVFKNRFGITEIARFDPNTSYRGRSCQHEGPDGKHHFCFTVTDGKIQTLLMDDLTGSFDPDDPESMFFYNGKVEYQVRDATWAITGSATMETDSSVVSKTIQLFVGKDYPNLYLLALELDVFLMQNNHGNFDDYIGELKDLI